MAQIVIVLPNGGHSSVGNAIHFCHCRLLQNILDISHAALPGFEGQSSPFYGSRRSTRHRNLSTAKAGGLGNVNFSLYVTTHFLLRHDKMLPHACIVLSGTCGDACTAVVPACSSTAVDGSREVLSHAFMFCPISISNGGASESERKNGSSTLFFFSSPSALP